MLLPCSNYQGFTLSPVEGVLQSAEKTVLIIKLQIQDSVQILSLPYCESMGYHDLCYKPSGLCITTVRVESGFPALSTSNTFPVGVGFCQSCPLCDSHGQHLNYSSAFCRWCVSTGVIIWPLVCSESSKCEADGMGVKWWIAPSVLSYCPKQMSTSILCSVLIARLDNIFFLISFLLSYFIWSYLISYMLILFFLL